jgi:hypothetical protein
VAIAFNIAHGSLNKAGDPCNIAQATIWARTERKAFDKFAARYPQRTITVMPVKVERN